MTKNEINKVRQMRRTLYRKAKQEKEAKFYSLYDKLWREDGLWEAWAVFVNRKVRETPF